ncbi:hypothetical protein ACHAXN_004346 [Cyclotella atomus]
MSINTHLPFHLAFVPLEKVQCNPVLIQTSKTVQWKNLWHGHIDADQRKYHQLEVSTTTSRLLNNKADSHFGSRDTIDPSGLFELMSPVESVKPDQMSASALAYLGDVVFELFIRSRYVWPERRMSDLQNKVVSIVRADAQAVLLKNFVETFPLTSLEQSVLSRGRNANLSARKKMKGMSNSGGGATDFQDSTAFEALIGYTYINDKNRFVEMMNALKRDLDKMDGVD